MNLVDILAATALATGCGGGGDSTTDANMTSSSAGVGLTITAASSSQQIGGASASAGNKFVTVSITLSNTGAKAALSTNPVLFSLATDASLDYNVAGAEPQNPCSPMVSVAMGGTQSCSLAFEVPSAAKPTLLLYNDVKGDMAMVQVPTITGPSGSCETLIGYIGGPNQQACSTCLQTAEMNGGQCYLATMDYDNTCTACGQSCASSSDPCQCEHDCDNATCQQKFDTESTCLVNACHTSCP